MNKILDIDDITNNNLDIINNILCSKDYKETVKQMMQKESKSLLTPAALAFLDQVARKTNVKSAIEIGTYFGGATKVIANAIKGKGFLITLDSNQDRKPSILSEIKSWSKLTQETTIFLNFTSNEFFEVSKYRDEFAFDLCFIDGDHSYSGALSDIINCSRFAGPNCILVVDDANQPPVYTAVHDFLNLYPNWSEINGKFNKRNDIDSTHSSFKELPFIVLVGPKYYSLNNRPYSIYRDVKGTLNGININPKSIPHDGEIQIRFLITHLNSDEGNNLGMKVIDVRKKINSNEKSIDILLDKPFSDNFFRVDAHIYWSTTDINSALTLLENPKLILS